MKLVIDISKEMYQECIETVASSTAHYESYEFHRMVQNGTLFDSVLEDIKTEIIDEQNNWIKGADAEWHECRRILQIIDNHISGKESE